MHYDFTKRPQSTFLSCPKDLENIKYVLKKNSDNKTIDPLLERFISYFVSEFKISSLYPKTALIFALNPRYEIFN